MTQILDLVYRGEADVGFVVNCLLEDVQALGKYKEEDFKVIGDRGLRSGSSCKHSTRLYPNWSFSIKPQMSPDESKAVVMALLSIPASEDISVHWTLTPDGTGADAVFQQLTFLMLKPTVCVICCLNTPAWLLVFWPLVWCSSLTLWCSRWRSVSAPNKRKKRLPKKCSRIWMRGGRLSNFAPWKS